MIIICLLLATPVAIGQQHPSVHQLQNEQFSDYPGIKTEEDWNRIQDITPHRLKTTDTCRTNKIVFGWHPYWMGTAYESYDYSQLSDIAYFSYEVNPVTGSYNNIYFWKTTSLVDMAKEAGTRVSLTVTLFSSHALFLENTVARQTLIDSLISLVQYRNADGVNIDFELIPSSQKANFTQFMVNLCDRFHEEIPGSVVSVALPAVDWNDVFDIPVLQNKVDIFIIMGYEYYWKSSGIAGPVSPKNSGKIWQAYDVTNSAITYLDKGIPPGKMCMGLPYYGYDWPVQDTTLGSYTLGTGKAVLYDKAVDRATLYGRHWEINSSVPYYTYKNGTTWHQCWYDDEVSLAFKYDMVKALNLAGIGIWALGYDGDKQKLWNLLKEKFSACGNRQNNGTFTDLGGPEENYMQTPIDYSISPVGSDSVTFILDQFQLANGDTLFYSSEGSTLKPFCISEVNPDKMITLPSDNLHFRFNPVSEHSAPGWILHWYSKPGVGQQIKPISTTVNENQPAGAGIPVISFESSQENEFSLVRGWGIFDNTNFRVKENKVYSKFSFNYEKDSLKTILVNKRDLSGNNIQQLIPISISDVNDQPIVNLPVSDKTIKINELFYTILPANTFTDEDKNDQLTYSAELVNGKPLPNWISFNPNNLSFLIYPRTYDSLTIKLIATDGTNLSASTEFSIIVSDYISALNKGLDKLQVYPNPADNYLMIELPESADNTTTVSLVSSVGQRVYLSNIESQRNQLIRIDISTFTNGVYFLKVCSGKKCVTKKISVIHKK
ncbi:MAG TPA: glycosyl hydrolase family 18 protein [Bacteroidales bacterium]|nr:glycosyl hydrolase family 18 protein [Bacteroidales bacterium]